MTPRVALGMVVAVVAVQGAGAEPQRPSLRASLARLTAGVRTHGSFRTLVTARGGARFEVHVRQRLDGDPRACAATIRLRERDPHRTTSATLRLPLRAVTAVRVLEGPCASPGTDGRQAATCSLVIADADRYELRVDGKRRRGGGAPIVVRVRDRVIADELALALRDAVARCR